MTCKASLDDNLLIWNEWDENDWIPGGSPGEPATGAVTTLAYNPEAFTLAHNNGEHDAKTADVWMSPPWPNWTFV